MYSNPKARSCVLGLSGRSVQTASIKLSCTATREWPALVSALDMFFHWSETQHQKIVLRCRNSGKNPNILLTAWRRGSAGSKNSMHYHSRLWLTDWRLRNFAVNVQCELSTLFTLQSDGAETTLHPQPVCLPVMQETEVQFPNGEAKLSALWGFCFLYSGRSREFTLLWLSLCVLPSS